MSEVMNVPEGWEVKNFSELAKVNMGQSPDSAYVNENQEGMAFLQGNADFGEKNPKECYWVTEPKKVSKKGDILISVRAPVGDMNIADKVYCIGRGLASLTINKIDPSYGFYALFEEKRQLDRLSQGSTFLAVGKNDFDVIKIKYPIDSNEQQKIAKILSTLDQSIEATQKLIAKERNIKKGLMHDLLTNGIDQNGKIRSPQTHKYKESELGLIPEGWEVLALEKCAKVTNSNVDKKYQHDEIEIQLCNYMDVYSNEEVDKSINYMIATATELEINKFELKYSDVIITKDSESPDDIGIPTYVKEDMPGVLCGYHLTLIRPNKKCIGKYLSNIFQSNKLITYFGALASGSTRFALSLGVINNAPITLPPIEEQKQIAKILTTQDLKIETEEKNLAKLKELKKGLMNDLLSGKVRVRV